LQEQALARRDARQPHSRGTAVPQKKNGGQLLAFFGALLLSCFSCRIVDAMELRHLRYFAELGQALTSRRRRCGCTCRNRR